MFASAPSKRDPVPEAPTPRTVRWPLELACRGLFPVHRGEFSLSLPTSDDDICHFIDSLKQIVVELES